MSTISKTRGLVGPPRGEGRLTCESAFEILSNSRRRLTLDCLAASDGEIDLRTLSTRVAARENGLDPTAVSSKQRKRTYTALRQTHLPKMDEHGVIEFDAARGTVTPTNRIWQLIGYVEEIDRPDIPRGEFYFSIVAIVGILVWLRSMGMFATPWLSTAELLFVGFGVLLVGSAVDLGYTVWYRYQRLACPL